MPKDVAAANQNADVSVKALAVALLVCKSCSGVDKSGSPFFRFAPNRAERKAQIEKSDVHKRYALCSVRFAN